MIGFIEAFGTTDEHRWTRISYYQILKGFPRRFEGRVDGDQGLFIIE